MPDTHVPILKLLSDPKIKPPQKNTLLWSTGDIDLVSQSRIANWLYRNLHNGAKTDVMIKWFHKECMAHAFTLILADKHNITLDEALEEQMREVALSRPPVDVDKECLRLLEKRLFDCTANAGKAGRKQWGLDSGHHQFHWDPYQGTDVYFPEANYQYVSDDEEAYKVGTQVLKLTAVSDPFFQHGRNYSECSGSETDPEPEAKPKLTKKKLPKPKPKPKPEPKYEEFKDAGRPEAL